MASQQDPKIKVIAFNPKDYNKKIVDIAELASKKFQRVFYFSFDNKEKDIIKKWKNRDIYPERFRIIDKDIFNSTQKDSILSQFDAFIKSGSGFDFADLIIFDSISSFTDSKDSKEIESIKTMLMTLLMGVLKKKISCLLPILKKDINSKPINDVSNVVDKIIEWDNPNINELVKELRNLSDTLLGPISSQILIGAAEGETPAILLNQFEQELGTILGPNNVRMQVEELREKYAGEFI